MSRFWYLLAAAPGIGLVTAGSCAPTVAPAREPMLLTCEPIRFGDDDDDGRRCENGEVLCYVRGAALSCMRREP